MTFKKILLGLSVLLLVVFVIMLFIGKDKHQNNIILVVGVYNISLGIFYFFERLDFEKKCLTLKYKKELLIKLEEKIEKFNVLSVKLIRNQFSSENSLLSHQNEIQATTGIVSNFLEFCMEKEILEKNIMKDIVTFLSFVENDIFSNFNRIQESSNLDKKRDDLLRKHEFLYNKVQSVFYRSNDSLQNKYLEFT